MTPEQKAAFENAAGYSVYEMHNLIVGVGVVLTLLIMALMVFRFFQGYKSLGLASGFHFAAIVFLGVFFLYLFTQ